MNMLTIIIYLMKLFKVINNQFIVNLFNIQSHTSTILILINLHGCIYST